MLGPGGLRMTSSSVLWPWSAGSATEETPRTPARNGQRVWRFRSMSSYRRPSAAPRTPFRPSSALSLPRERLEPPVERRNRRRGRTIQSLGMSTAVAITHNAPGSRSTPKWPTPRAITTPTTTSRAPSRCTRTTSWVSFCSTRCCRRSRLAPSSRSRIPDSSLSRRRDYASRRPRVGSPTRWCSTCPRLADRASRIGAAGLASGLDGGRLGGRLSDGKAGRVQHHAGRSDTGCQRPRRRA